jgi:hypothetical protein
LLTSTSKLILVRLDAREHLAHLGVVGVVARQGYPAAASGCDIPGGVVDGAGQLRARRTWYDGSSGDVHGRAGFAESHGDPAADASRCPGDQGDGGRGVQAQPASVRCWGTSSERTSSSR